MVEIILDATGRSKRPKLAFGLTLQSDGCVGSQRLEEHLFNALDLSGGRIEIDEWLHRYNLAHRKHDLIAHLSGGQRRKVAMLAGILPGFVGQAPSILLLDEPAAGLDAGSRTCWSRICINFEIEETVFSCESSHRFHGLCNTSSFREYDGNERLQTKESKGNGRHEIIITDKNNAAFRTGFLLNQRTLSTVASNGIAGFLTLGIFLALIDSSAVDSSLMQASGLFLSAALRLASLATTWFQCCMNTEHWIGGKHTVKVFQTHTSTVCSLVQV